MRSSWENLHQVLIRSLTTASSVADYRQLRADEAALAPFATSGTLLERLPALSRSLDEVDQIYAALVRAAQGRTRTAQVAHTLLMCGLWPGLDRFYRRRVGRFRDAPHELSAAISGTFTLLVGRIDLRGVNRVAATLVRSTRREAMSSLLRARAEPSPFPDGLHRHVAEPDEVTILLEQISDLRRPEEAFRLELRRLCRTLRPILEDDTELVLLALVLEEHRYDAAARLGITPAAAQKRFQRAVNRLRAHCEWLSQRLVQPRVL